MLVLQREVLQTLESMPVLQKNPGSSRSEARAPIGAGERRDLYAGTADAATLEVDVTRSTFCSTATWNPIAYPCALK